MFKVLCPMESRTGHKWWMRMGSAFTNKDNSINLYLDAIPTKPGAHLQLRELTEEDMRIANERRAAFNGPRNGNGVANAGVGSHVAARHGELDFPHPADDFAANSAPF
jgi:hypothetical protein